MTAARRASAQLGHHSGIKWRKVTPEHLRAGSRRKISRDKNILVRQRHTFKPASRARRQPRVGHASLCQRDVVPGVQKRAKIGVRLDTNQKMLRQLDSRDFALTEQARQLGHRQIVQIR